MFDIHISVYEADEVAIVVQCMTALAELRENRNKSYPACEGPNLDHDSHAKAQAMKSVMDALDADPELAEKARLYLRKAGIIPWDNGLDPKYDYRQEMAAMAQEALPHVRATNAVMEAVMKDAQACGIGMMRIEPKDVWDRIEQASKP